MTMFAEPVLAGGAEEGAGGCRREYGGPHYQHHGGPPGPEHLRGLKEGGGGGGGYPYPDPEDREVGGLGGLESSLCRV